MQIIARYQSPVFISCFLLVSVCISGCGLLSGGDGEKEENRDQYKFEVQIKEEKWSGYSHGELSDGNLRINGIKENSECWVRSVYFTIPEFNGAGSYPIFDSSYAQIIGCDGHKSLGSNPDTTGTATITSYDEASNLVVGTFEFELRAYYSLDNVPAGEKYHLTGSFEVKLEDK
ncbi:hypothetical protein [Fodinibius salsisoli]|uniref:Lipoprotein n=1 Tax=Fodinibius salsisoli TaxID=2820877 RepID=A0ABT3PQC7_9BACT|nr:hypothetical protein [Fodinibius salsisoli]MCW9708036.1 hypothetical protein [Fodinibius salsisoli]